MSAFRLYIVFKRKIKDNVQKWVKIQTTLSPFQIGLLLILLSFLPPLPSFSIVLLFFTPTFFLPHLFLFLFLFFSFVVFCY